MALLRLVGLKTIIGGLCSVIPLRQQDASQNSMYSQMQSTRAVHGLIIWLQYSVSIEETGKSIKWLRDLISDHWRMLEPSSASGLSSADYTTATAQFKEGAYIICITVNSSETRHAILWHMASQWNDRIRVYEESLVCIIRIRWVEVITRDGWHSSTDLLELWDKSEYTRKKKMAFIYLPVE